MANYVRGPVLNFLEGSLDANGSKDIKGSVITEESKAIEGSKHTERCKDRQNTKILMDVKIS